MFSRPEASGRLAFPLFLLLAGTLFSQDFASLTITVVDSTDAMVPDASVSLVNTQRRTIYHQQTPTGGYLIFDALTPGDYSVKIEKTGFQSFNGTLTLAVRDRQTMVVELKVAEAQATSVEVKEKANTISNDAAQGVPLGQNYIQDIPVNGRNTRIVGFDDAGSQFGCGRFRALPAGSNANGLRANTNLFHVGQLESEHSHRWRRGCWWRRHPRRVWWRRFWGWRRSSRSGGHGIDFHRRDAGNECAGQLAAIALGSAGRPARRSR